MSNLTNNTSGLQDILAAVNALPEAGGGSSGLKTCTIKIVNECVNQGAYLYGLGYHRVIDGEVDLVFTEYGLKDASPEIVLENAVCGTYVVVEGRGYSYLGYSYSGNLELLATPGSKIQVKTPTEAGAVGIVTMYDTD